MGSKRIPGKNIHPFDGLPIICYAVASLSNSDLVDRVIISTDDKEKIEDALSQGSQTSIEVVSRSAELSDDHTTSVEVLKSWLRQYPRSDIGDVILTYQTSVFSAKAH